MQSTVEELLSVVRSYSQKIGSLSNEEFSHKPSATKWSKKEVLGHLIDSAQNNLRRFITGQYESTPPKIVYEQDFWVMSNHYHEMEKNDVIMLWKLMNERIAAVLMNMAKDNYTRLTDTGKTNTELRTLEWLAADYVKHMKHHLNQIIPNAFDIVYP
jgi:hypothetical protein